MTGLRYEGTCWLAGRGYGRCSTAFEWHHVLRQQLLRRYLAGEQLEHALRDHRWVLDTCDGHHAMITAKVIEVTRSMLPTTVFAAAASYRLEHVLDREYGAEGDLATMLAERTGQRRRAIENLLAAGKITVDGEIAAWGALVTGEVLGAVVIDGRPL